MNKNILIASIVVVTYTSYISNTFSSEKSQISVDTSVASTSDHINLRTLDITYKNHRRELNYPYLEKQEKAFDYGLSLNFKNGSARTSQFSEIKVMPFVGKKFNNSFFSKVGIGHGSLKNSSNGESANFTPYMGEIEYQGEKLWGSFKLNKDSVTEDINFPGGLDHFLTKNQYLMSLLYVHKKFRIRFTNKYTFISDQNERFYEDIDLKYNISRDGHWILVGLGGSYYWNKKDIEGYWTPKRFISYGPRFESTWAIKDKNFIYMSGNINLFYDETSTSGTGYYLNVAYQRGKRNDCNMKLGYERIQSKQKTGKWFMDRPYVNLTCFW